MFDDMFSFIEPIVEPTEESLFDFIARVETLFESPEQFITEYDSADAALSSKVREVIEKQWGKRVADLQDLYVGRFYERLVEEDGQVSYRPANRYVLRAKFYYAREPQQITFSLTG